MAPCSQENQGNRKLTHELLSRWTHAYHLLCGAVLLMRLWLQSCLLCGKCTDDRQLEGLSLRSAVHEERPEAEATNHQQQVDWQFNEEEEPLRDRAKHHPCNHPDDPEADPCHVEENRLERMETHEPVRLERIDHEKDNPGDEAGQIRESTGSIGLQTG